MVPLSAQRRRTVLVVASVVLIAGAAVAISAWATDDTWIDPATHRPSATGEIITVPGGEYAFMATQTGDEPVTYDPCQPIRVVVNPRTAPPGGQTLLGEALDEVAHATGLTFTVEGRTDESEGPERDLEQEGDTWAPVLIEWSDPDRHPDLDGRVLGMAGSTSYVLGSHRWYVSGSVLLDGPDLGSLDADEARAVIMHELAHLVGLDHVDSPDELMHATTTGRTDWGTGDLAGLAALGQGRCADG